MQLGAGHNRAFQKTNTNTATEIILWDIVSVHIYNTESASSAPVILSTTVWQVSVLLFVKIR